MCIQAVLISHRAGTGPYLYQLVYNVSHQADESTRPGLGPQLVRGFKTAPGRFRNVGQCTKQVHTGRK